MSGRERGYVAYAIDLALYHLRRLPRQPAVMRLRWGLRSLFGRERHFTIRGDGRRYIGRHVIVGITYTTHDDKPIRQEQFHGPIVSAGPGGIIIRRADTGARVSLPPVLEHAFLGHYRLASTQELVIDPHYVTRWVRPERDPESGSDDSADAI